LNLEGSALLLCRRDPLVVTVSWKHFSIVASLGFNPLHFDVRSQNPANSPLHLRLALTDTEAPVTDRHPHDRVRPVAATLLETVGYIRLVNIDAGIERLHINHEVQKLKVAGKLTAQIDQPVAPMASQRRNE
jgi:hypothetical protein